MSRTEEIGPQPTESKFDAIGGSTIDRESLHVRVGRHFLDHQGSVKCDAVARCALTVTRRDDNHLAKITNRAV